jgi:hypothetical protein
MLFGRTGEERDCCGSRSLASRSWRFYRSAMSDYDDLHQVNAVENVGQLVEEKACFQPECSPKLHITVSRQSPLYSEEI